MSRVFEPRPYQQMIIDFVLENKRCAVWCSMGGGKTVSTLTALEALMMVEDSPILVLAPLRVATTTWPDEIRKWKHLNAVNISVITGTEKQRIAAVRAPAAIYATNYEQLVWLTEYWGDKWPYRTLVMDEVTRVKSLRVSFQRKKLKDGTLGAPYLSGQGGKRARALATVAHTKIDRIIELTGTPASNGLKDLWGPAWFLDAGKRLGNSFDAFKTRWFRTGYDGLGMEPLPGAQKEIESRMRDVCLTIDGKDWFDLKEPIRTEVAVTLPPKARLHYKEMENEMYTELEGIEHEAFNAAAKTIKCQQFAGGAIYTDEKRTEWSETHTAKLEALESIIEEASGMPVLVAYNFKSDLARIMKHFPQARELDKKPQTIKDWNDGKIPILLAHPASAGHGLNLQDGGNILVYFSPDWNLENHLQILERIGPTRQLQAGHNRPVYVYHIIATDTIDEVVMDRLKSKRSVQDALLAAMKRRKAK